MEDEQEALRQLKDCPKIVQYYVRKLTESRDRWQELTAKAIGKIRTENIQKFESNPLYKLSGDEKWYG